MKKLSQQIGYNFRNSSLLKAALTHRSIRGDNNERLEFLGDALLNCIIATALYYRCPQATEGELSRLRAHLVKGDTLAVMAQEFQLGSSLRLGASELKTGGIHRKSILADAMEALIAAIYLDSNMESCQSCVLNWFDSRLDKLTSLPGQKDPKTCLQEHLQARKIQLPNYRVLSVQGEAHQQLFHVQCTVEQLPHLVTEGTGSNRRSAEQEAAKKYLELLELHHE